MLTAFGKCVALLCFLALTACEQHMAARVMQAQSLAAASKAEGAAERAAHPEGRTLAYEHTVSLELRKELLPARINDVRDACDTHKDFQCTVLDVSISAEAVSALASTLEEAKPRLPFV